MSPDASYMHNMVRLEARKDLYAGLTFETTRAVLCHPLSVDVQPDVFFSYSGESSARSASDQARWPHSAELHRHLRSVPGELSDT